MPVQASFKRLFVRKLLRDASEAGISFEDALWAVADARVEDVERGKIVIGTSANGNATQFSLPSFQGVFYTPADICDMVERIFEVYEDAQTALGDSATDGQLVVQMLIDARMQTVRHLQNDYAYFGFQK